MQRYGAKIDEGPNIILGGCDLQMVFRLHDNASTRWMSERIGVYHDHALARRSPALFRHLAPLSRQKTQSDQLRVEPYLEKEDDTA